MAQFEILNSGPIFDSTRNEKKTSHGTITNTLLIGTKKVGLEHY